MTLKPVSRDNVLAELLKHKELWISSEIPELGELAAFLIADNVRRTLDMIHALGFVVAREVANAAPDFNTGFWVVVRVEGDGGNLQYGEQRFGPYKDRDRAGTMGHHHARRAVNEGAWEPTYQVYEDGQPVSDLRLHNQHWTKAWPEKERRECARCGLTIVSSSEGWIAVDSGGTDGMITCPAGGKVSTMHTPKRKGKKDATS